MKFNKWTAGLAAVGVISLASAARADEPMSQVQTSLSNTTLSGYVDTAVTWRPGTDFRSGGGTGPSGNIPAYSFAKNDGFSLNAIDIAIDRPMDESPWAAGYHIELMDGPDAVVYNNSYLIRQAYLTLRTPIGNGIDWKVGIWDTIIGYESTSDPLDPNYTRSYGYTIEPNSHTGILGTYKVNDMISVSAGIANSWNSVIYPDNAAAESQKSYMGSLTFTAPDSAGWMSGATLSLGVVDSTGTHWSGGNRLGVTSWYAGITMPTPVKALKLGTAFDYLDLHNSSSANPSDDSIWVLGLYSSYQATDKLSFNLRGEYLSNDGSSASSSFGQYSAVGSLYATSTGGNAAEELTATLQYNLWANVISRLEFRWDHVEHGNYFGSSSSAGSYGDPNRANDFLLALNLIYQF